MPEPLTGVFGPRGLRDAREHPSERVPVRLAAASLRRTRELDAECRALRLVNATALKLSADLDERRVAQVVVEDATELCAAQFGVFFFNAGTQQGRGERYALCARARDAFASATLLRNAPLFDATCGEDRIVRSDDLTRDRRRSKLAPHFDASRGSLPVRSYLGVPVRSRRGEPLGGLFFGHARAGVFAERAERLVAGMAAHAAAAMHSARDREAERHARECAQRASELKDAFLASVSHELRAPLAAIAGWARVIAGCPMEGEALQAIVAIIERSARAQDRLIDDLLDLARISAGRLRLERQPIHPATVVEAALQAMRPAAEEKGVRLAVLLDANAGPLSADPVRLRQVVSNLLSNALAFTPKGGVVQVVLRSVGAGVEIAVADTGVGIDAALLPHVFDRFRQAGDAAARPRSGLGLGLAIARGLVELHGGRIRAASPGEGRGATFTVMLPLVP